MDHRRNRKPHAAGESFFRFLFLILLFLSVLRAIDLLPAADTAFSPDPSPIPTEEPLTESALPLWPQPISLSIANIETSIHSRGLDLRDSEPKILIYHTHTTEAYTATKASPYVQTSTYRTRDVGKSVIAVGEALAQRLRTQYGFSVIHDITDHEPPSLKTAYDRSEQTMLSYLERYPSLVLFIDIHRDASSDTSDYVMVDGLPTARLMCVVGQGTKYAEKPDFETNYALASTLTENLRRIDKCLARDVRVKTGRYNQHVGQMNLLIEVGHNANTLEQALNAVPSLAESLALALADLDEPTPVSDDEPDLRQLLVPDRAGIDKG